MKAGALPRGPEQVVIDITNRCNQGCIGCWLYSPLLKDKPDARWLGQEVDFSRIKDFIDDLAELGTERIRFTGGGEPFMHPRIMESLEYAKAKGLICCVTTNFSLLSAEDAKELIKLQVDELAISLWASNEEMYQKIHAGAPRGIFKNIKENLMVLTAENERKKTFITLCNVVCKLNYLELKEMFRFALDVVADGVYFTLIDAIDGLTDPLLLDEAQRQEALRQAESIRQDYQGLPEEKRIKLEYFDGFISRLRAEGAIEGNYDRERVNKVPCYAGWNFARILADGTVCPCCRGVKKPMGNINIRKFKEIWFSQAYHEFRYKAYHLAKDDSYFSDIGCLKMCDNLMHNEEFHSRASRDFLIFR